MLLVFHDAGALDFEEFTAVYRGSALENCERMYPNEPEPSEAMARYEREHRAYMEGPFFREEGSVLFVEAQEGRYLAAVKLYPWKEPGCWHVEALETRPEERGKGHGARVLGGAVRALEETGNVIVLSDVAKSNEASLRTHLRCGFHREAEQWTEADGTVTDRRCTMVYRGGEADKGRT